MMHLIFILVYFSIGDRPNFYQLQKVQGKYGEIRVIDTIAGRWEEVAIALHLSPSAIEAVRGSSTRSESAAMSILTRWYEGSGRTPVDWKTFIDSLENAKFHVLAQDLKSITTSVSS